MSEPKETAIAHVQRRLACNLPTAGLVVEALGEDVLALDDPQALANAYEDSKQPNTQVAPLAKRPTKTRPKTEPTETTP